MTKYNVLDIAIEQVEMHDEDEVTDLTIMANYILEVQDHIKECQLVIDLYKDEECKVRILTLLIDEINCISEMMEDRK